MLQNFFLPHWRNWTTSRGNRLDGEWPDSNLTKREGSLAEVISLVISCGGYHLNMDGTRYFLLNGSSDEDQGHNKLNFSMVAMRLSKVWCSSANEPHICLRSFSSRIPSLSSLSHKCLNPPSIRSKRLTVITFLKTSINHWGSKTTNLFSSSVSSKCIIILWSCKKSRTVKNSW